MSLFQRAVKRTDYVAQYNGNYYFGERQKLQNYLEGIFDMAYVCLFLRSRVSEIPLEKIMLIEQIRSRGQLAIYDTEGRVYSI